MPDEILNGQEEVLEPQGEEQPEEVSTSEEPTEEPQEDEAQLPEDAKERTKREFEKLREHNRQLADENKRLKGPSQPLPSVLDYLPPQQIQPVAPAFVPQVPYPPMYQPPAPQPQLVDEQGYVNTDVLRQQLERAEKAQLKAEEAEKRSVETQNRISKFEQDVETKELYKNYPELDPLSDVYDPDAFQMVRDRITSQIVSTGTRNAMKAAQEMEKYFRQKPATNAQVLQQRKQATSVPGTTQRPQSTNLEDLKLRSRNDPDALYERLQRSGY